MSEASFANNRVVSRATRSAPLLAFVLRDPRLHQFLNKCSRQWLIRGELDSPFGCGEALKFVLKRFDNRGSGEQTAVVRKRGEPHQHSFVLERRNPIADGLGSLAVAQRTESPRESCSRCCGRVPERRQGIHQRFSERRCLSPQTLRLPDFTFFMRGKCYENFRLKSMLRATCGALDMDCWRKQGESTRNSVSARDGDIVHLSDCRVRRIHGHVNCAAPKVLSCEPPSGFMFEEGPVPARTVAVPVNPGRHCANPFWSTVTPGLMFPTHKPRFEPTHHVTSWLVSCTGDGGLLKAPVATNETWPLEKFRASAAAGFRVTDCNWRLLPHPAIPSVIRGRQERVGESRNGSWQPPFKESFS